MMTSDWLVDVSDDQCTTITKKNTYYLYLYVKDGTAPNQKQRYYN